MAGDSSAFGVLRCTILPGGRRVRLLHLNEFVCACVYGGAGTAGSPR